MTTLELEQRLTALPGVSLGKRGDLVDVVSADPDTLATEGAIAWISPRVLEQSPDRLTAFGGSVLILPEGADATVCPPSATALVAEAPKLVFSRAVEIALPHLIGDGWAPDGAPIHVDAQVSSTATLAPGVVLGAGVVIGEHVQVGPNTCIAHTTIEAGATIGANCSIGLAGFGFSRDEDGTLVQFPHVGRVRIGQKACIGSNTCIDRGSLGETVVGAGTCIDNLVHVAHNVEIGRDSLIIALAMLGGSVSVGDRAWVAPSSAIINQKSVGNDAGVGLGAVVIRDVLEGQTVVGNPAKPLAPR